MSDSLSFTGIIVVVVVLILVFGRGKIMQSFDQVRKKSGATSKSKTSTTGSHPKEDENSMV